MPSYDYLCKKCNTVHDVTHKITETPIITCPDCGSSMERQISLGSGFIMKGGSPSIHWKEKRLRYKMNEAAGERMKKKYGESGSKVVPNVAGVPQESWSDCQKLAKECGMNSESYTPYVEKENKKKIKVVKA